MKRKIKGKSLVRKPMYRSRMEKDRKKEAKKKNIYPGEDASLVFPRFR